MANFRRRHRRTYIQNVKFSIEQRTCYPGGTLLCGLYGLILDTPTIYVLASYWSLNNEIKCVWVSAHSKGAFIKLAPIEQMFRYWWSRNEIFKAISTAKNHPPALDCFLNKANGLKLQLTLARGMKPSLNGSSFNGGVKVTAEFKNYIKMSASWLTWPVKKISF